MKSPTEIAHALLFAAVLAPADSNAKGLNGHASVNSRSQTYLHRPRAAPGVPRDSHGKIARSPTAVRTVLIEFAERPGQSLKEERTELSH